MHPAAHIRQLPRGHGREEAGEGFLRGLVIGLPGPERATAERERDRPVRRTTAPAVTAVHDQRLLRVEFQAQPGEPTGNRIPHLAGTAFTDAADHHIICKAFERDSRGFPCHPSVEAIMQKQNGEKWNRTALGVPFTLWTRLPSGISIGAFSQRPHRAGPFLVRVARDRLQNQIHGTVSKKDFTLRSKSSPS